MEDRAELVAESLRSTGRVRLRVSGRSMFPWIRPGDVLFICQAELHQVLSGNVVVFVREGRLVVHRVIQKCGTPSEPLLVTKGDAVADADAPVSSVELLGCVAAIYRGGRRINLDTVRQAALGRLLAHVSSSTRLWYPAARLTARAILPLRRALSALRAASAL